LPAAANLLFEEALNS